MVFYKFCFYYKIIFVYFYYNYFLKYKDFFKIYMGVDEILVSYFVVFVVEKVCKENCVVVINEDMLFE